MPTPLQRAIALIGSQSKLAEVLNDLLEQMGEPRRLKYGHIQYWLRKGVVADPVCARLIEQATDGQILRHELRPDIYPPEEYFFITHGRAFQRFLNSLLASQNNPHPDN